MNLWLHFPITPNQAKATLRERVVAGPLCAEQDRMGNQGGKTHGARVRKSICSLEPLDAGQRWEELPMYVYSPSNPDETSGPHPLNHIKSWFENGQIAGDTQVSGEGGERRGR